MLSVLHVVRVGGGTAVSRQVVEFRHRHPSLLRDCSEKFLGVLTSLEFVDLGHRPDAEVATVCHLPLIVLFGHERAHQPHQRVERWERRPGCDA